MTEEGNTRTRVNISENSKGLIQRDLTMEIIGLDKVSVSNPNDLLQVVDKTLAVALWDMFEQVKEEGKKRGYKFVGENGNE